MAIDFLPLGKCIFAGSIIQAGAAPHGCSRGFLILNLQVNSDLPAGRDFGLVTSAPERITTVFSLCAAAAQRFCCSAVYTSCGFSNSPEHTTMLLAGAVMLMLKSPY